MTEFTRADVCAVAIAEAFRGGGEILANPMGTIPVIGCRLARATFEPELMMTDGEAALVANHEAVVAPADRVLEYWNPYRSMFDWVFNGRRHVMMGAAQIDPYGNQNIAAIGDPARPAAMLLGYRGAPSNTINDRTSYWVPRHSPNVFVERVDTVTGIGWDRAADLGEQGSRFVDLHHVVSDLGVFDFETPDRRMRIRSLHPGVTIEQVVAATGFELAVDGEVPTTREPTEEELHLLTTVIDPANTRAREVGG